MEVAQYLEGHFDDQITVKDLVEMMNENLKDSTSDAYGFTHMKSKLQEYFKDSIIFTNKKGLLNVVSHKEKVSELLQQNYKRENMQ